MPRPESITGGCLYGSIRFTISFPNEEDWPPRSVLPLLSSPLSPTNTLLECYMSMYNVQKAQRLPSSPKLRLPQSCAFPTSTIAPPLTSNLSYKTYASSPSMLRGFCSTCGSALSLHDKDKPELVEINVGSFDENALCGERDEGNAWEDEYGRHVPRIGGVGREMCGPGCHNHAENEIEGVTDGFEGVKWLTDREGGKGFRGRVVDMKK